MRKQIILFPLCLFMLCIRSNAQADFRGTWEGKVNVGVELRVIFHIAQNPDKSFSATTDSPDQGAFGLKCDTTIVLNDSIRIEIRTINAVVAGRLTTDSTIAASLSQGISIPVLLKRTSKAPKKQQRPQTPQPPFPYKSEDVEYDNADKSIHYGATITIPQGEGPFPAAVLITGSGQQDRDETINGHKLFAVLADALTRNGIAVLRVDDRQIGKTTGSVMTATSEDFAADVSTSLDYLLSRPEVNKKKTGLIGHSEGGMIAPMVAAKRKDIDFIILLAGPGVKITQLMTEQNDAILGTSDFGKPALEAYGSFYNKLMDIAAAAGDSLTKAKAISDAAQQWIAVTDTAILNIFGYSEKDRERTTTTVIRIFTSRWFSYFLAYDPQLNLQMLRCKVLALNGSRDIQVIAPSNLAGIKAALKKSKSKDYIVKELPGLNHLFQTCKICNLAEYNELEETISPVALKEINDWFNKHVK